MFECIIDEAIRSIRERERRRMKQEEDRTEKKKVQPSAFSSFLSRPSIGRLVRPERCSGAVGAVRDSVPD